MPLRPLQQVLQIHNTVVSMQRQQREDEWRMETQAFERTRREYESRKMETSELDRQFKEYIRPLEQEVLVSKRMSELRTLPLDERRKALELDSLQERTSHQRWQNKLEIATKMREYGMQNQDTMDHDSFRQLIQTVQQMERNFAAPVDGLLGEHVSGDFPDRAMRQMFGARQAEAFMDTEGFTETDKQFFFTSIAEAGIANADPELFRRLVGSKPTPDSLARDWVYKDREPPEDDEAEPVMLTDSHREAAGHVAQRAAQIFRGMSDDADASLDAKRLSAMFQALEPLRDSGFSDNEMFAVAREAIEGFNNHYVAESQKASTDVITRYQTRLAEAMMNAIGYAGMPMVNQDTETFFQDVVGSIQDVDKLAGLTALYEELDGMDIAATWENTTNIHAKNLHSLIERGQGRSPEAIRLFQNGFFNALAFRIEASGSQDKELAHEALGRVRDKARRGDQPTGAIGTVYEFALGKYLSALPVKEEQISRLRADQRTESIHQRHNNHEEPIWHGSSTTPVGHIPLFIDMDIHNAWREYVTGPEYTEFDESVDAHANKLNQHNVILGRAKMNQNPKLFVAVGLDYAGQLDSIGDALKDMVLDPNDQSERRRLNNRSRQFKTAAWVGPNAGALGRAFSAVLGGTPEVDDDSAYQVIETELTPHGRAEQRQARQAAGLTPSTHRRGMAGDGEFSHHTRDMVSPPTRRAIQQTPTLSRRQKRELDEMLFPNWMAHSNLSPEDQLKLAKDYEGRARTFLGWLDKANQKQKALEQSGIVNWDVDDSLAPGAIGSGYEITYYTVMALSELGLTFDGNTLSRRRPRYHTAHQDENIVARGL